MLTDQTLQQAITAHQEGRIEEAERLYQKILKSQPMHVDVNHNLGIIKILQNKSAEALPLLKVATETNPNSLQFKISYGTALMNEKKYEEAERSFKEIIELESGNAVIFNSLGLAIYSLGRLDEAEVNFKKAIELNPNSVHAYINLGSLLNELKRSEEAEACLRKAIELNPNKVEGYYNLGIAMYNLKKLEEAEVNYKKAIELKPDFAEVHNNLAETFLRLGEFEKYWDFFIKYLQSKSNEIVSKANLQNVIPKLVKKIQKQNRILTFFDNAVLSQLKGEKNNEFDYCDIFEKELFSKEKRFVSYSSRIKSQLEVKSENKLYRGLPFELSQGVHSTIKWKEINLCKTNFDLVIYSMILQEVKPDTIIELGSGLGGSAIWFADTASALGLKTHIYSYDINKPSINHKNVTFIEYDLNNMNKQNLPPCSELFKGKKILIEDAHVNLKNILNLFDTILKEDDYLMIEDSDNKHDVISKFLIEKESKYRLDQFFLDFFGRNVTCCGNSIFKIY